MKPLLSLTNVSWSVDTQTILKNISFDLEEGRFIGLLGPNGAGKSSLMRCIYRVNKPDFGTVNFQGKDIWQGSASENAQQMAVILQEQSEHLGLSVYEVIALGLTPHKKIFEWDSYEDKVAIKQVLQENDLTDLSSRLFSGLSGGEKQRVMLARAMLQKPKLLIMDEPTNHLDVHYQVAVLQKVKRLNVTVLASFHDLNLAAAFCDSLLVLNNGELVAYGTPQDVLTESLLSEVFNTHALIDKHPLNAHPRITFAYHDERYND
ncbi:MAG: ABC transporter ATP-binding protein [Oleiphilus sp.]